MLSYNVFHIPNKYAVNITTTGKDEEFAINFYKIEDSYLSLLERFTFNKITDKVDERLLDCNINEGFNYNRKVVKENFIKPLQEIVKQMKQYYVDHNLVGDKECYVDGLER